MSMPTDGQGDWGSRAELDALQSQSPLAGVPDVSGMGGVPAASPSALVPFSAPTERPDEDVTAYAPPPGEGDPEPDWTAVLIRQAYAARPTPHLRMLLNQLEAEGR